MSYAFVETIFTFPSLHTQHYTRLIDLRIFRLNFTYIFIELLREIVFFLILVVIVKEKDIRNFTL